MDHGGSSWIIVDHRGLWWCLRGVGCHKAPRDVTASDRRQGDDAAVGHDQHADGDPQQRGVHRPARRCKPAGRARRRQMLANDARPMWQASWLRLGRAGPPEAAFSAKSCLGLPLASVSPGHSAAWATPAGYVGLVSDMAPDLKSSDQKSFSRPRSQLRYQEQSLVRWFVVMKRQRAQAAHRARHACAAACAETDACAESAQLPSEPPVQSPSPGRVTPQKPDDALRSQASASVERCPRSGRIHTQRAPPPTHRFKFGDRIDR